MKAMIKGFQVLSVSICGVVCSLAAHAKPFSEAEILQYACVGESIEDGYVLDAVIRDERLASSCADGNVLQIMNSASVEARAVEVCQGSVIPVGWVIVATIYGAPNCAGPNVHLAYRIEKIDGLAEIDVCSVSAIPSNWVITASKYGAKECRDPDIGGYLTYTIKNSSGLSAMRVCTFSPIPSGWVISGTVPDASCRDPKIGGYRAHDLVNIN